MHIDAKPECSILQGRRFVVAQGRRDGNSRFSNTRKGSKKHRPSTEQAPSAPWWEDGEEHVVSAPQPPEQQQARQNRRSTHRERQEREQDDGKGWWEDPREASLEAYAPGELEDWQIKRLEQAFAIGRKKIKVGSEHACMCMIHANCMPSHEQSPRHAKMLPRPPSHQHCKHAQVMELAQELELDRSYVL